MSEAGFKRIVMTAFARLNRINKALHQHLVKSGGTPLAEPSAEELLAVIASPGTDWYILAHSLRRDDLALLEPDSILFQALNTRCRGAQFADIVLNGYMTSLPLGDNRPLGVARFTRV